MKKKKKYNYIKYNLLLDPELPEDKKIIEWLKSKHSRHNKYTKMIRDIMYNYIKNIEESEK